MKAIMISIQPKWCELIANGQKTIEVRKTKPKIDTPFKCYIYCTKGDIGLYQIGDCFVAERHRIFMTIPTHSGRVVGEFVCDKIYKICSTGSGFAVDNDIALTNRIANQSCLDFVDMKNYLGTKGGYGWHISDLKIYDKPKELWEFRTQLSNIYCKEYKEHGCDSHCISFNNSDFYCKEYAEWSLGLTRPPQSWCYVEEL